MSIKTKLLPRDAIDIGLYIIYFLRYYKPFDNESITNTKKEKCLKIFLFTLLITYNLQHLIFAIQVSIKIF